MNQRTSIASLLLTATITLSIATQTTAQEAPDPAPWSFLEGTWDSKAPDGTMSEFTCELNKEKNCYLLSSPDFQGTLGIDPSSDLPMLAIGYHPGNGYSVGHWKRESDTVFTGGFWFIDTKGTKEEFKSRWEKTDSGVVYSVDTADGKDVYKWNRK